MAYNSPNLRSEKILREISLVYVVSFANVPRTDELLFRVTRIMQASLIILASIND